MMANASPSELWNVFILAGTKPILFQFSPTATVREIRQAWEEHVGQVGTYLITACDGSRLSDALHLADVGEVAAGSKTVNLVAEKAARIFLKPYRGQESDARPVAVDPSQSIWELRQQVVSAFQLPQDRIFRLISDDGPLESSSLCLELQGIEMDSVVEIDFGYSVDVVDEEADSVERRIMFSSEDAASLLGDGEESKRLMIGPRILNATGDFYSALPQVYRKVMHLTLEIQTKHEVTALVNKSFTRREMWSSDIVATALSQPLSQKSLKCEGTPIQEGKSLKEMNLPNHALLYTSVHVPVKLSDGKRKFFDVAEHATIADLAGQVQAVERSDKFLLKSGARVLDGEELVSKAAVGGREIAVARTEAVNVRLSRRCVRWEMEKPKLRFTDIMNKLAEMGIMAAATAADLVLQCRGCGRRLRRAEETDQAVPADCCRVRSLELCEYRQPKMRDRKSQGRCSSTAQAKSVGRRPSTVGVKVQRSDAKSSARSQHPPESPLTSNDSKNQWKFRVCNKYIDALPGEDIPLDIDFPPKADARVRDVRSMISKKLNLRPDRVKLYRWVGYANPRGILRRRREEVYDVYSKDEDWFGFSDLSGAKYQWTDVTERHEVCLHDLNAVFPIVMAFRNFLTVSPN